MPDFFILLIQDAMRKKNLGLRPAAKEIGISHTTLDRILKGDRPNITSAEKIANWLGLPMTDVLNTYKGDESGLSAKIATAIQVEPALAAVFDEAIKRLEDGSMQLDTFREMLRYMAFRLQETEGQRKLN